jgi:hypothetical protein
MVPALDIWGDKIKRVKEEATLKLISPRFCVCGHIKMV